MREIERERDQSSEGYTDYPQGETLREWCWCWWRGWGEGSTETSHTSSVCVVVTFSPGQARLGLTFSSLKSEVWRERLSVKSLSGGNMSWEDRRGSECNNILSLQSNNTASQLRDIKYRERVGADITPGSHHISHKWRRDFTSKIGRLESGDNGDGDDDDTDHVVMLVETSSVGIFPTHVPSGVWSAWSQ